MRGWRGKKRKYCAWYTEFQFYKKEFWRQIHRAVWPTWKCMLCVFIGFFFIFFFWQGLCISNALAMQLRMASNPWSSCPCHLNAVITKVHHHAQLLGLLWYIRTYVSLILGIKPTYMCVCMYIICVYMHVFWHTFILCFGLRYPRLAS